MCTLASGADTIVLVIYSHIRWEKEYRRFLYDAIARVGKGKARVLCVDRPLCPVSSPLLRPHSIMRWLAEGPGPREVEDNLFLYTPWVLLHDQVAFGHRPIVWANRSLLNCQIESALKKMSLDRARRVTWIGHPFLYDWIGIAREELTIYECIDEYAALPGLSESKKAKLGYWDRRMLENVDVVIVSSQQLLASKREINPNTYNIGWAAEPEHFAKALDAETEVPGDVAAIRHPIIGFTGGIWGIFDIDLLHYVAASRPNWTLLLVGNLNPGGPPGFLESFKKLTSLANVTWLGWRDHELLPSYLKPMDVCLMPFVLDEWTVNCHPGKMYQYLGAGRPVVSTDLPEVRPFKDVVRIARSREEFLAKIEESLKDNTAESVARRRAVAAQNTFETPAQRVWESIERHLGEKA